MSIFDQPRTGTPILPAEDDDFAWTTSYFITHLMTDESRRYGYIFWIIVGIILIGFTVLHWTGSRGGWIGSWWTKNTLRRRTWRKKSAVRRHRQPVALPSISQLAAISVLFILTFTLATIGPDYIVVDGFLNKDASAKFAVGASPLGPGPVYSATRYLPLQLDYTVNKQWWTSANRWGIISYALMPLCVIFVLKQQPLNIFAIPWLIQLHSDKLAWLHRWSGRFVIILVTGHVALWSVQLAVDRRIGDPSVNGTPAYKWAFLWSAFVYGWIGFGMFLLIGITSIAPIREKHYDIFYYMHLILVPLALIGAGRHHPPTGWWAWTALAFWVAERLYRGIRYTYINGLLRSLNVQPPVQTQAKWDPSAHEGVEDAEKDANKPYFFKSKGRNERLQAEEATEYAPLAPAAPLSALTNGYLPPPGYVHAELVSGRTIRLRMVTPGYVSWAPGQYFNIKIPSVSHFSSHPFTTASICDDQAVSNEGRVIVFLVRAKSGWTKDLWDSLALLTERRLTHPPNEAPPPHATLPSRGALLRMHVDGPYGSAERAKWGHFSTVLIVTGGSGVSFGLSVLEFATMCMAGRDASSLGARAGGKRILRSNITRVRFVWLVREFAHIQWCASAIRRCMAIAPPGQLQIDIHVTLAKPDPPMGMPMPEEMPHQVSFPTSGHDDHLMEEKAGLLPGQEVRPTGRGRTISMVSADDVDDTNDVPGQYSSHPDDVETGGPDVVENEDEHPLDFTNFDGEDDGAIAGEATFSRNVRLEGKLRRASTRKATRDYQDQLAAAGGNAEAIPPVPQRFDGRIPGSPLAASPLTGRNRNFAHGLPTIQQSPEPPTRENSDAMSMMSEMSDTRSLTVHELESTNEELRLEVDANEIDDIAAVAEYALKGRPKLDRIIKTEQERATGAMVVATCGPTALNANLRKIIALRIDPARVRRGDLRGSIELISEEFNT